MVKEELKKIWRPGMILAVLLLGIVYDSLFLSYYIRESPFRQQDAGMVEVCKKLVQSYGTGICEEEFAQFQADIPLLRQIADQYVSESRIGKKYGLKTYEQYAAFLGQATEAAASQSSGAEKDEVYADAMQLHNYLDSAETGRIEGQLYAACLLEQTYEVKKEYNKEWWADDAGGYSQKELEHMEHTYYNKNQMWQNILPPKLPQTVSRFTGYLLVLICLSNCLMLSPLLVRDRLSRMQPLQYSSRKGRKIYYAQSAAVLLSAFIVTTMHLVVFGGLFLRHGTSVFAPCRMYSFTMMQFCWPNWTHGAWCLMLAVLCYLTAFAAACIVFFLSQGSTNYITMLLRVIPLAVALSVWSPKLLEHAFYSENALYRFSGLPYIEILCAGALFLVGVCLWILGACRRSEYL